ncbi:MAG: histidine kinase [Lachnospiraceae bacterium]|nr:histidine kinase [Lachnospiraceae bacterium]
MTEQIRTVNLILAVAEMVLSVVGFVQSATAHNLEKKSRHFFMALFGVCEIYVICILLREFVYFRQEPVWVVFSRILFFGQAFFASLLPPLITGFILYQSREKSFVKSPAFIISFGLWLVYILLLVVNVFNGMIYRVDDQNRYTRGPLFQVLVMPTVLIMGINLITVWLKRKKLSSKQIHAFTVYAAAPMIAMILQMFFFGVHLISLSSVIAALFMLSYIIAHESEQYHIVEAENAKLKVDILLAQIQPHFLFNCLTTIKNLCVTDPALAEKAVGEFTMYLRHNMDSLTEDGPIPFKKELEHVYGYVSLQQLRFKDELDIRYDIECDDFMLPVLTLQPIVENAVTYGIRKKESGRGTVLISTKREGDHIEICVADDGPGFLYEESSSGEERSHIGLRNVRDRVRQVSNGDLLIDSVKGKGTTVKIIIPADIQPAFRGDRT